MSKFLSFGEIWMEILAKYNRDVISKVHIFCLLFNQTFGHSWALVSTNELSWALMSNYGHFGTLMGTQEHSRSLKSMVLWCQERAWVLIRAHAKVAQCSWGLIKAHGNSRMPMSAHWCSKVLLVIQWHTQECSWAFMSTHGHSWVPMSP